MAYTVAAHGVTGGSSEYTFLGRYLHKVAQETLYPQLFLYQFGQKVPLPGNSGKIIHIPYFIKQEPIESVGTGVSESAVPGTEFAVSGDNYTGEVAGYHGFFGFSDFFYATHEVPGVLAAGVRQLAAHMAKTYDNQIRDALSALTAAASGTGASACAINGSQGLYGSVASGSITSGMHLSVDGLLAAEASLGDDDAMAFPDGTYACIISPAQGYDMFTDQAGTGNANINISSWLQTTAGQSKYERAVLGTIGRLKIMTSTQSVAYFPSPGTAAVSSSPMAASTEGYGAYVIAPGAYAVVDLQNARPSIIIQPFGSAGTADPTKKKMTVGMKGYWTQINMDTGNRFRMLLSSRRYGS